jgi:hypothetical protein
MQPTKQSYNAAYNAVLQCSQKYSSTMQPTIQSYNTVYNTVSHNAPYNMYSLTMQPTMQSYNAAYNAVSDATKMMLAMQFTI